MNQRSSANTLHKNVTGGFAAVPCAASGPLDASAIASGFRKSKNLEKNIAAVLASLPRLGHVATRDGKTFAIRRAA